MFPVSKLGSKSVEEFVTRFFLFKLAVSSSLVILQKKLLNNSNVFLTFIIDAKA